MATPFITWLEGHLATHAADLAHSLRGQLCTSDSGPLEFHFRHTTRAHEILTAQVALMDAQPKPIALLWPIRSTSGELATRPDHARRLAVYAAEYGGKNGFQKIHHHGIWDARHVISQTRSKSRCG